MSIQHKNIFLPQAPTKQKHVQEQASSVQGRVISLMVAGAKKVMNLDPLKVW